MPERERDDVRNARERRERGGLDDDRGRARVRAPDVRAHRAPVLVAEVEDARDDERGDEHLEPDDR